MYDVKLSNIAVAVLFLILFAAPVVCSAEKDPWIHPDCKLLPSDKLGPFVQTNRGVLAIDGRSSYVSDDGGLSWSEPKLLFADDVDIQVSNERALFRTRDGAIIAAFMNLTERQWTWDDTLHDAPGARLPTLVMRSLDEGRTWQDVQKMHDDWSGAVRDMIQTKDGRVIFTAMKMLHDPGRHSVLTYSSTDDGKTWRASNLIDLGGAGHHGGVTEPTLTELADGRLWMLIRTNWGEFWSGYSHDGGRSWRVLRPSGIAAASAPGLLRRLASGRLLLVWNRPLPEGKQTWPKRGGDRLWSETPVSNHREELSLALSADDGKSWTKPVVIARKQGASLAYPYIFEHEPGRLWLTTMQGGVRVELLEQDFLDK
jgi:sialidase-1